MSFLWTADEVQEALEVETTGWAVQGVSIDTRTLAPGDLFVAIPGERFDGHDYVSQAVASGAAAVLVSKRVNVDVPQIIVPDTLQALRNMAVFRRRQMTGKVIGLTGSVGKTSVTRMLFTMAEKLGKAHRTEGNLNNHIGLPLSMVRMPRETEIAMLEMGMNHAGEIAKLTMLARPDVAIVTTVEEVHLEFFDSVEAIAAAKAEIYQGMTEGGVALLPVDSQHFPMLEAEAKRYTARCMTFGMSPDADVRLVSVQSVQDGQDCVVAVDDVEFAFHLRMKGKHQAYNAVAAIAAIHAVGGDIAKTLPALAELSAPAGRGQLMELPVHGKIYWLLDDSYNASPSSMCSALAMISQLKDRYAIKRSVAVLGDMLELGGQENRLHKSLLGPIEQAGIDLVHCVGPRMRVLYDALPDHVRGIWYEEWDKLLPELQLDIRVHDLLLVKGSHGSSMWRITQALQKGNI